MKLSKYVTLKEAIKSNTATRLGVDNSPSPSHLEVMKRTAALLFDPIREFINAPLGVSSFYRSKKLNTAIKGSITSQHCKGEAIDIDCDMYGYSTNKEVFDFIKDFLDFNQLIWEYGNEEEPAWVHVSQNDDGPNRKQILRVFRDENNEPHYIPFDLY
jgi:zinc D-Ala-D-Ala carboxypeptidase